ncbi:cobalamin-binding protein [Undibacterium oligocarboniphilum]|uniref:Cobalamin-binding protein n=1 Tax=Undibacterium oligocarboniphilum TaxID=666702 RepID=A0A850QBT0_9BURK|nr:cobalamin-binding protein [Undibacterium oligocarboniphilum]MBC3869051.1 cobalamin-binding protein [Undibacterium oligocarboniphilum]NVO77031.1 cobalamin-binding protein [Undibacterium oligocarboniphilum]
MRLSVHLPARLYLAATCVIASAATALSMLAMPAHAAVSVQDDAQRNVTLNQPARRIVSLAPHTTELLFAAGAGSQIVAISDYSNFPDAAKSLPSVGNVFALDLERLLAYQPDLIVIWGTGNARLLANKLRDQHLPVFESEPRDFEMVASSIERLSVLAGTSAKGKAAAQEFRQRLAAIQQRYQQPASTPPVRVFYQVWNKPLMTLNDTHLVSVAIRLCGGQNIFGHLKEISPTVTTEAVLTANPDAIITGGDNTDSLQSWRSFGVLNATRKGHFYAIPADWLNRAGPRILDGTEALCKAIAAARTR